MNLQEETRKGYTISANIKEVWAVQMEMAKYLFSVCDKYGLKIWAEGGTLLGAIREKGYIPWDDDMDFVMLRDDYDKLIAVADEEFKSPYHLQSFGRDKLFYRGHAQMRCDGTTAILPTDLWRPFHQGIFIDVFVADTIPNEETPEWKRALERADFLQDLLMSTTIHCGKLTSPKTYVKYLKSRFYCLVHGKKKLIKEYDDLFRQFNLEGNTRVCLPCFIRENMQKWTREKNWYREGILMPFEDMEICVPIDYDKVLKTQYGNNYLSPVKEPSMHGNVIFDTKRDYKVVQKELRKKRRKEIIKSLIKRDHSY